ncbi:hypothetical protein ES708_11368 [subsurface metagenome]
MPKQKVTIKLDDHVLAIVGKYQRDHSCDRTKAISQIIRAYPLHLVKLETKKLASNLCEGMEEPESVMPEICKHITDFDMDKGGAKCALLNRYVSDDKCRTCPKREPVKEGNEK